MGGVRNILWSNRHLGGEFILHRDHVPKWVGVRYRLRLFNRPDNRFHNGDSAKGMGVREASDRRSDGAILVD